MEKEKLFLSEGANSSAAAAAAVPFGNSCSFGMETHSNKLNCSPDQLPNCFFNPNWDSSMDQSDPFESALSSIVSSPVTTSNAIPYNGGVGDPVMIRELIGRLGNICNSGEISYINSNSSSSTNTLCYSTPLNSPPKLNNSLIDSQITGNLPILGKGIPEHPSLASFPADPGFVERAARYSCFGNRNLVGLNDQFGLGESELSHRLMPRLEPGRVSSNLSMKAIGHQANVNVDGNSNSDMKFSRLSRSSTPENAEFGDSREESSVSEQIPGGELSMKGQNDSNSRKRKAIPRGKAKETPSSSLSASDSKVAAVKDETNAKRSKSEETNGNEKDATKAKEENSKQKQNKDNPEPPKDYIHVRARRGQATDSHSLAERVRREKISERMKFLQDLVPGCNKVTGKAVMLDEIINYVQSLQRQVEFLSMKLATVNPRMDINMESVLSKDIFQGRGSLSHNLYPLENSAAAAFPYDYQSQQGIVLQNGMFSNGGNQFSVNPLNVVLKQNQFRQLPAFDGTGDAGRQVSAMWEDDLQSVVQMGFGKNQQYQDFRGSNMAGGQMKVEL